MRSAALLLALAGCADEVVSDLSQPECDRRTRPLALHEESSVGVTPAEIVEMAEGRRELPLRWYEDPRGELSVGPETGTVSASLDVSYAGAARFVDQVPIDSYTSDARCPDLVEVDLDVSLSTPGGALAERFVLPVGAGSDRLASGDVQIDEKDLRGTLHFTGRESRAEAFGIRLDFGRWGVVGAVSGHVIVGSGDLAAVSFAGVGGLGTSHCEHGFVDMPLEATYGGRTPSELVGTLGATALQIGWEGGEPLPLAFSFVPAGGCLDVATGKVLAVPGDLAVSAGDLQLRAPGSLRGSEGEMVLEASAWSDDLATFAREAGETGLDLSAFDGASWRIVVTWRDAIQGHLAVGGVQVPDCVRHPRPGEGCDGVTFVPVSSAEITADP